MSKLSSRKIQTTPYFLGEIQINLKSIPFGKVLEIKQKMSEIENDEDQMIVFIKDILLEFTDLEADDLGSGDTALTLQEAQGLFKALLKEAEDPKALGLPVK